MLYNTEEQLHLAQTEWKNNKCKKVSAFAFQEHNAGIDGYNSSN